MSESFSVEPFQPHHLMSHPHVQTLAGNYYRNWRKLRRLSFRREMVNTPDDDFFEVDYVSVDGKGWRAEDDGKPVLILLHGLEGSSRQGYACDTYRLMADLGWRSVGMNYRSCGERMNRTAKMYHMGFTDDLALLHRIVRERCPESPIALIGFSLGGNLLLKYLGEHGSDLNESVVAAAAISPPFSMHKPQRITQGINQGYGVYLLRHLQRKTRIKSDLVQQAGGDAHRALTATTIREFDEAVTAPVFGFRDADDYYSQNDSLRYLASIDRPTLILRSVDDPFFVPDQPYEAVRDNPWLFGDFPMHGGHAGFIEGLLPWHYGNWALRQAARFFTAMLGEPISG